MSVNDDIEQRYLEFLQKFGGNIRRFATDVSENHADAMEIMQDIFAALWVELPQLNAPYATRQANRWLYRVMSSVLARHLRKRPRHIAMPLGNLPDIPDDMLDGSLLDELIPYLNLEDRAIVQEIRDGYSTSEIAERHHLSTGTVYTRLHRIKNKLKSIYAKLYGK